MTEERRKEIFMYWYHNLFKEEIYYGVGNFIIKLEYHDDWKSPNRKLICEAFNASCACETEVYQLNNSDKFNHKVFKNIVLSPLQDFNANSVTHEDGFSYLYEIFNRDPSVNCWIFLKEQAYDISKDDDNKVIPYSYHGYPKMCELNAATMIFDEYQKFASIPDKVKFIEDLVKYCENTYEEIDNMPINISPFWNTERTLEFYDALMNFSKEYLESHKVQ